MFPGSLETPSIGLLVPLLPSMSRSNTGRKPQRSSPLAGPAVLVSYADDNSSSVASPIQGHGRTSLSPPKLRPRPKSMVSDYSTLSLHPQPLTPRSRPHAPGTKQIIRPISSVLPFSATQEHFSNASSSCSPAYGEFRSLDEQYQHLRYINTVPLTSSDSKRISSTTRIPTISINEKPIDVPPPARSTSRMTGTLPRDNSWYIASAYDDTPRFSRLGLSADNVVLPVSTKEFKKSQRHRQHTPNSDGKDSSGNRRSLLMECTLASTLKLARSFTRTSSDHQLAQEPSSPSTPSSLSSQASTTFPGSDSSTRHESLSPHPSLSRTRTSSFTNSSSSSYTCFVPDIVTSPSRTSVKEEKTQDPASSTIPQQDSVSGKDRSKKLLTKRRTLGPSGQLRFNPETRSVVSSPVLEKDEKKRRGASVFKKFIIRLFVPL